MANLNSESLDDLHPPFEAYAGTEPNLFVSYSHQDKAAVFAELARLHAAGFRIWYDEGINPGSEWPVRIQEALEGCAFFMVFLSPQAIESKHVRNEIHCALDHNKPFLAVHLEETVLRHGLALRIGQIQAIHKFGMTEERYARQMERVLPESLKSAGPGSGVASPSDSPGALDPTLDYLLQVLPDGRFRAFELGQPYYTVGRSGATITIPHRKVSRRHLVLARIGSEWMVLNVSNRNRMLVGGWELRQKTLRDGDAILIGGTWLVFLAGNSQLDRQPHRNMGGKWSEPAGVPRRQEPVELPAGNSLDMSATSGTFVTPAASAPAAGGPAAEDLADDSPSLDGTLADAGHKFKLPPAPQMEDDFEKEDDFFPEDDGFEEMTDIPEDFDLEESPDAIDGGYCCVEGGEESATSSSVDRPLLIGNHPHCSVRVQGVGVAPLHCLLSWLPKGLCLLDLGSGHATLLDGKPIRSALVKSGQKIGVGKHTLRVEILGDPTDPARSRRRQTPKGLALTALQGPHEGETALLSSGRDFILGRLPSSDLWMPGDRIISRRHLELRVESIAENAGSLVLRLRDLGGRNTPRVNTEAVTGTATARLGDVIHFSARQQVSGTTLLVHYDLTRDAW